MADGNEQPFPGTYPGEMFPRPQGTGINFYGSVLNGNISGASYGDSSAKFMGPVNQNNSETGSFRYPPRPSSSKFPSIARKSSDASASLYHAFAPQDLYPRMMFPRRKGYAMWYPEPDEGAPPEYRKTGVQIGDLVLITGLGGLGYLFNICLPADHPVNAGRVPEDFKPLKYQLRIQKSTQDPGSFIPSSDSGILAEHINNGDKTWLSAKVPEEFGEGMVFNSNVPEGALLILPEGGSTVDLYNQGKFYDYANNHALAWYKYVNGVLGYEADNGSLYLVTGCDKSRCWGVSAFSTDNPEDIFIEFIPRNSQSSTLPQYRFGNHRAAAVKAAPAFEQQNQAQTGCTFVRGFRVAVRPKFLHRMMGQTVDISSIMDLSEKDIIKTTNSRRRPEKPILSSLKGFLGMKKHSGAPFGKRASGGVVGMGAGGEYDTEDTGTIEQFPRPTQIYHPSDIISRFILENHPDVDVSVIHDDIWCSLVNDSDTATGSFPDDMELLERFLNLYTVEVSKGVAHLRKIIDYRGSKSIAYSPDGQCIASGSSDSPITLWNASTGECLRSLTYSWEGTQSLIYSPDGTYLASGSFSKDVWLWDLKTTQDLDPRRSQGHKFQGHNETVLSVSYSPDGKCVASCSFDGHVRLWDPETGKVLYVLQGHPDGLSSVAYSPDGSQVASGSFGKNIIMWNTRNGHKIRSLQGHRHAVLSVAYSPDGQRVVSGSFDKDVRIWSVKTGECLHVLRGHTDAVLSVAYSPDGIHIASGSMDCTVTLWDGKMGKIKIAKTLEGHTGAVSSVAFSPDARHVASGSFDCTVRIWEVVSGDFVRVLQLPSLSKVEKPVQEEQTVEQGR
ncbi:MAPK-activated protein kinase Srk1 [Stygiomarasmius scandens]|uniref:MAPK-activated protein kinase Srk1 n=1 Tax=Marasmiellus scandens TaxID=2682957 RepID=A0ABR1ILW0_9AGAR